MRFPEPPRASQYVVLAARSSGGRRVALVRFTEKVFQGRQNAVPGVRAGTTGASSSHAKRADQRSAPGAPAASAYTPKSRPGTYGAPRVNCQPFQGASGDVTATLAAMKPIVAAAVVRTGEATSLHEARNDVLGSEAGASQERPVLATRPGTGAARVKFGAGRRASERAGALAVVRRAAEAAAPARTAAAAARRRRPAADGMPMHVPPPAAVTGCAAEEQKLIARPVPAKGAGDHDSAPVEGYVAKSRLFWRPMLGQLSAGMSVAVCGAPDVTAGSACITYMAELSETCVGERSEQRRLGAASSSGRRTARGGCC